MKYQLINLGKWLKTEKGQTSGKLDRKMGLRTKANESEAFHLESKSWILYGEVSYRERERGNMPVPMGQTWRLMAHLGTGRTAGGWPLCTPCPLQMWSDHFQILTNQISDSCNGKC